MPASVPRWRPWSGYRYPSRCPFLRAGGAVREVSASAVVVGRGVAWRAIAVARYHVPHKDCPAESDRKTQDDGDDQSGQGTPPSVLRADLPEGNRLKGR